MQSLDVQGGGRGAGGLGLTLRHDANIIGSRSRAKPPLGSSYLNNGLLGYILYG